MIAPGPPDDRYPTAEHDIGWIQRMHWRRYRRGLATIPVIVVGSTAGWAAAGGGYFWPRWVILWGGVTLVVRTRLAFGLGVR